MDLKKFKLEDLLLAAIKSEVEAQEVYETLASKVKTAFLLQKLDFLAIEEAKHKKFLETVFQSKFPKKAIKVPKTTPVPLPSITVDDKDPLVSQVLDKAMAAETASKEFYESLAGRFKDDKDIREGIGSLAQMEANHYKLLEVAVEKLRHEEDYIIDWPLIHAGP